MSRAGVALLSGLYDTVGYYGYQVADAATVFKAICPSHARMHGAPAYRDALTVTVLHDPVLETADADMFLVLRVFKPDLKEVVFKGSNDPHTPVGLGWLRASHRKLDPDQNQPYRPYHTHDEIQP